MCLGHLAAAAGLAAPTLSRHRRQGAALVFLGAIETTATATKAGIICWCAPTTRPASWPITDAIAPQPVTLADDVRVARVALEGSRNRFRPATNWLGSVEHQVRTLDLLAPLGHRGHARPRVPVVATAAQRRADTTATDT